ncbi:protein SRG1-like [Silene latifolia]|uniref:protein SRG1-like n=1 Tax=Silene latifolia TaxID=37657 RepID=UPI003D77258F
MENKNQLLTQLNTQKNHSESQVSILHSTKKMLQSKMAEPATQIQQGIASNLVEEIAKNGEEIPDKFIHKDGFPGAIIDPDIWKHSLLIDFSVLTSSTPASAVELAKLRYALCHWGCFQVVNHGVCSSFLEELIKVIKQFFALPLEEKLKCSDAQEKLLGYGTGKFSTGDQAADWNDGLYLILHPEDKRSVQFYPLKPENFCGMINEYSEKLAAIAEATFKAMARSLDLDEDCFVNCQRKKTTIKGRFICYPPCPRPERVLGVKSHSDGTYLTILLPDNEVNGLQVQKDEHWYKVPVIPGALFINLGDLGEVMSNGMYKSVVHRVVTNAEKGRVSVAAFFIPEDGCEIGPISELVSKDHPQKYKKFEMSEFRRVYFETFAQGLRAVDALKLH